MNRERPLVLGLCAFVCLACAAKAPGADALPRELVDAIGDQLAHGYVFPERAAEMTRAIEARAEDGAYDDLDRPALASALTRDLQAISHDGHLRVLDHAPAAPGPAPGGPQHVIGATSRDEQGVAYIELLTFGVPTELAGEEITRAMNEAADASALILDLRANGGGMPKTVVFVASYLFDARRVHFDTMTNPSRGTTEETYTDPNVPGPHFGANKPVYVLTSKRTFSGAEEFAYCLQALARVTVVGEASGGGAHAGGPVELPHDFALWLPQMRPVHPVTHANWEGTGVVPDVVVAPAKALDRARELAHAAVAGH